MVGKFITSVVLLSSFGLVCFSVKSFAVQKGFFVGAGFMVDRTSGGFNGDEVFCSEPTCTSAPIVTPGKIRPADDNKITIKDYTMFMGYMFNPYVGIESFVSHSEHTADRTGGKTQEVELVHVLYGVRLQYGDEDVELLSKYGLSFFARLGISGSSLSYSDATFDGNSYKNSASFSGEGNGYGFGVILDIGKGSKDVKAGGFGTVFFELGYTTFDTVFNQVSPMEIQDSFSARLKTRCAYLALATKF